MLEIPSIRWSQEKLRSWQRCGLRLAPLLRQGFPIILDMDGVVVKGDSLEVPTPTTTLILSALQTLESLEVPLGVATARSWQIIDYLRENNLQMNGPLILEGGQLVSHNGDKTYMSPPQLPLLLRDITRKITHHDFYCNSWDEVLAASRKNGRFLLCPGNIQWQGETRKSFWFMWPANIPDMGNVAKRIVQPVVMKLARSHDLTPGDVSISVTRTTYELGIIEIKGALDGKHITKASAVKLLKGPHIFAADGFGDYGFAVQTLQRGGMVVGIKGNLDVSGEPSEFLRISTMTLQSPNDFTHALLAAADMLRLGL